MIRTRLFAMVLLAVAPTVLSACKKSEAPPPPGTMLMFDVKIELPRLEQEFQTASPELQAAVTEIKMKCRRWQMAEMLADLDRVHNTPGLSESQKKAVEDVMGEAKQVLEKKAALVGK